MPLARLQKILAEAGLGSRRKCEAFIEAGHVTVNGRVVQSLGAKADPDVDDVRFRGSRVRPERKVYFLVNKPRGYICSNARGRGKRVIDLLTDRIPERVYPVGRLDVDSEGLIILTNDGALAQRLAHPRYGVEKTYRVEVEGRVEEGGLAKLARGVFLREGRTAGIAASIRERDGECTWLEMTLREGKNREIRRVLAGLGYRVRRLRRVRIGPIRDPSLKPGEFRQLRRKEMERLRALARGAADADDEESDRRKM